MILKKMLQYLIQALFMMLKWLFIAIMAIYIAAFGIVMMVILYPIVGLYYWAHDDKIKENI